MSGKIHKYVITGAAQSNCPQELDYFLTYNLNAEQLS